MKRKKKEMSEAIITKDVEALLRKMYEAFEGMSYDGYRGIVDLNYEFMDGEDEFVEWALKLQN